LNGRPDGTLDVVVLRRRQAEGDMKYLATEVTFVFKEGVVQEE
jgi:hypothetical protein